ncbi:hypothetical protein Misp01_52730 [Microtetraspora sp. NBRC 13810]|uniref:hypothetical protein n=1 Tax=Microtetraspora sp. NBRC 13810 TaxID=3030990 RepID=UPI002554D6AD|nr:hypothetical protein [Microtetraspora sp. NBRC 13810]GLW10144.1 hypothetical protein Misp01_52730 [Microtetraspora sp. NBRC 13810]
MGILLLTMGAKGAEISQTLSLVVGVAGCLITIYFQKAEATTLSLQPGLKWTLSAVPVVILAAAASWWFLIHKPDRNITDLVAVHNGHEMRDMDEARIALPAASGDVGAVNSGRDMLALRLRLVNPATVGNCVSPATLTVTPTVDGKHGMTITTTSDAEIHLSLAGAERQAGARVVVDLADPGCAVNLTVTEAVLYN